MSAPKLSTRGRLLVESPAMPAYLLEHFARSASPYHPQSEPHGYIPMCVAENKLVWDLLEPMVNAPRGTPPEGLGYADMVGPLELRQDLATFLGTHVLGRPVDAEHVAVLAGAGSILEVLFYALADRGEGVLVPTPSYAGFWMDLEVRDELRVIPVHARADTGYQVTLEHLDAAVKASDVPVRALLFTTPNNPLGTVYSPEDLEIILDWAETRDIHVVFDEIYALSVFGDRPFTSVATLREKLGDKVHIVWAFSKDFAASGLRVGVLVSENPGVLGVMNALSYWSACSGDTLQLVRKMVTDPGWLEAYLDGMRSRLAAARGIVEEVVGAHGIPIIPGSAAFFAFLDLREFLATPTWEAEEALWRRLLEEANVNLTPGAATRSAEPGLFRLCFASVPEEVLRIGLTRLVGALAR